MTEAVSVSELRTGAGDHRWVLGVVEHALACVARHTGWESEELSSLIASMVTKTLPLVHFFNGLSQVDGTSGLECVPWLSCEPGDTRLGGAYVKARDGAERSVTVLREAGSLYLEDTFPVAGSTISNGEFVLVDKTGRALARVPLHGSGSELTLGGKAGREE